MRIESSKYLTVLDHLCCLDFCEIKKHISFAKLKKLVITTQFPQNSSTNESFVQPSNFPDLIEQLMDLNCEYGKYTGGHQYEQCLKYICSNEEIFIIALHTIRLIFRIIEMTVSSNISIEIIINWNMFSHQVNKSMNSK